MDEQICSFSILRELRKRDGMSIADLAERSGVSSSVISKLERNQCMAEITTLYRIAKVFSMTLSDLVSLAERRTSQRTEARHYRSGDFHFDRVAYRDVRCMHAIVKRGEKVSRPEIHRDDYELCWVLTGAIRITLPEERMDLASGMSVQFDALLPHTYEALCHSEMFIVHIKKEKRF